jgi:capsular exopolysaccharide synthesis family protein
MLVFFKKEHKRRNDDHIDVHETSPIMESYAMLRTNVTFSLKQRGKNALVVTSSVMGEGKSTTCANLAKAFAMAGFKTIIVDLDLRRPVQHKVFGVNRDAGIMDILNEEKEMSEVILPAATENLYVLPCGHRPQIPSEVLNSKAMLELLHNLSETYDMVIIDTPPAVAFADAVVVSGIVGSVLLVVSAKKVNTGTLKSAINNLKAVETTILGIVMNNLDKDSRGYNYGSYNNYYRYY